MFYEHGVKFSCQRCSYCCSNGPGFVYLSRRDLEVLAEFYKISPVEFVEKYCRWTDYYEGKIVLALQEAKNPVTKKLDCILWNCGCSAYAARPVQCSTYPFWDWMLNDKTLWNEVAQDCPGMNSGAQWTYEQIEDQKKLFTENIPISIEEFDSVYNGRDEA